jgi:hypothetical protein
MTKLINAIFPLLNVKMSIINALLAPMPMSTKEIVIDRLIAKHLPKKHLHENPKRKNDSYETEMDRASQYIDKYKGY